jgi:hypothetical protein
MDLGTLIGQIILLASVEDPDLFRYGLEAIRLLKVPQILKVVETIYETDPSNEVRESIAWISDYAPLAGLQVL